MEKFKELYVHFQMIFLQLIFTFKKPKDILDIFSAATI